MPDNHRRVWDTPRRAPPRRMYWIGASGLIECVYPPAAGRGRSPLALSELRPNFRVRRKAHLGRSVVRACFLVLGVLGFQ